MGMDKKIEKKGFPIAKILLYGGILAAAIFLFMAIYRDAGTSRLNVESERLLTDTVHTGIFKEYITLFGTVEPIKTVRLDAQESGRVEEIYVEDGVVVKEGQKLMRLSNSDLQLAVLNQEAQIITQINNIRNTSILMEQQSLTLKETALDVEYRIDQLEKSLQRNKKLYNDNVISQVDFEAIEDEYEHLMRRRKLFKLNVQKDSMFQALQAEQMSSSLDLMKRNLDIARQSLENLVVKAPISGQLSSMDAEIGQMITGGANIAQIDILNDFKIRARIDEFYISRVFPQQEGTFTFDGKTYTLLVKKIYPEVTNGAFEVDLVFTTDAPQNIKRGQTLSIKLSLSDDTQAMLLAKGGFYRTTGGNWVYVIEPGTGKAYKKDIKVGRQNPNYYEVIEGLQNGEIVITSSYENFGDKDELVLQ